VRFFPILSIQALYSGTICLEYLPPNQECDFSKDLFPLAGKDEPMYGYIAEGYWCDVGHQMHTGEPNDGLQR